MIRIGSLLIFSLLVGCVSNPGRVVYVATPLPLPSKPELVKMNASDLECLSSGVQKQLWERDKVLKDYINELRAIIETTHHH